MRKLCVLLLAVPLWAQEPAPAPKPRRPPPEPKNLQVLKIPADQIMPTMQAFAASLGQKCNFCHVQGNFASDENEHKGIARKMIAMTSEINARAFDGKAEVTCFTCHRGEEHPKNAPSAGGEAK